MIALEKVRKSYPTRGGAREIIKGVDLVVRKGQRLGILGGNGAGKSTLIRLISGIEQPSSGRICSDMRISWPLAFTGTFQGALTGVDNLRFICRIYGADHEEVRDFVEDFSQLGRYMREPVKTYSSGMRARLAFALSMIIEFDCYLIDEVIAVGDSRFQARCHEELFVKRKDRALIMVSHGSDYLRAHCDTGCVLINGELLSFVTVEEAIQLHERTMAA